MAKKDFQARQRATMQAVYNAGEDIGIQRMWDYFTIALRDPEIMGKNTFGQERLKRLYEKLKEISIYFAPAFQDCAEADYYQEILDRNIREAWSEEDFHDFKDRYPALKQFKYDKPRKKWK